MVKSECMKAWMYGATTGIILIVFFGSLNLLNKPELLTNNALPNLAINTAKKPLVLFKPLPRLPFGGREVLPNYRFVALYGSPEFKSLGTLGEQPLQQTITRTKKTAEMYAPLSTKQVIPTFEIIATIASSSPTGNQDYSRKIPIAKIKPWIEKAKKNNIYVILDLQPGRSTFLQQAKYYKELLKEPNVGLALDPEWRLLTPKDRHLASIGSVTAEEINQTSTWLADLVKKDNLPQKIFVIHQFRLDMILNRKKLDTGRKELGFIIQMDGHGTLNQKNETWNTLKIDLNPNIYMGWKNFLDEDKPTPTPQQTMAHTPSPSLITYQ